MSAKVEKLLQELRQVLLEAVVQPASPGDVLLQMQKQGLSAFLVVEAGHGDEETEVARLALTRGDDGLAVPVFRIDHQDLTILRSLGIDPTRSLRRRR
ncbi:MAG: hypothetical protein OEM62_01280 [Acidobacteriota bacterium]|nr:hypothetical protein [Acidobacteriota bacterium]